MLVVAHTNAPSWIFAFRTFDVPLMVFVSALCYKPLMGGVLAYIWKRFKRIYIPVSIFLVLFFTAELLINLLIGKPHIDTNTIIGSFLLLNYPSIGYVWIMRVFLMMAFIIPLLHCLAKKLSFYWICGLIFGTIFIQSFIVMAIDSLDNVILRFVMEETVPYAIGYSTFSILGLKIKDFKSSQLLIFIVLCGLIIGICLIGENFHFNPQRYKYPPQSLYLIYGLFMCAVMFAIKPLLERFIQHRFIEYLSTHSMWIYLWHIIPVYLISPWMNMPNFWALRYVFVTLFALGLNFAYEALIRHFPVRVRNAIK